MPLRLPAAGPAGVHVPALVDLGAGVEIEVHPVTNRRYAEFVGETGHRRPTYWEGETFPPLIADHPVVGVDLFDALAFCLWAGADLPTQDEWMRAAGGPGRVHPWGREFDATKCNTKSSRLRGTSPVDAYPDGRSPLGCYDMVGNVWEWTRSPHAEDAESAIVKGGSWYDFPAHTRIDTAFRARMNRPGVTVGFRCVHRDAPCEDTFLPQQLVAACMRARRTQAETERQHLELDGGEESLDDLRSVAREHLEGLVDAAPGSLGATPGAAGELLEVFDRLDDAVHAEELQEQQEAARPTPVPVIVKRDTVVLPRWAGLLAVSLAAGAALLLLIQVWTVGDGFDRPREAARVQTDPVRRAPEPRAAPKSTGPEYLSVEDLVQAQAGGRDGPVRRLLRKAIEGGTINPADIAGVVGTTRSLLEVVDQTIALRPRDRGVEPQEVFEPSDPALLFFTRDWDQHATTTWAFLKALSARAGAEPVLVLERSIRGFPRGAEGGRFLMDPTGSLRRKFGLKAYLRAVVGTDQRGSPSFRHTAPLSLETLERLTRKP